MLESQRKPLAVSSSKCIKARFNNLHTAYMKVEKKCSILGGDKFNFVQCSEGGVNIQAGVGKAISLQTMGHHGPFHMKMIWPLNLLCSLMSMPQCIPYPPCMPILPEIGPFAAGLPADICQISHLAGPPG